MSTRRLIDAPPDARMRRFLLWIGAPQALEDYR